MSPIYDLSIPEDRLALEQSMINKRAPAETRLKRAVRLPSREARIEYVAWVRAEVGTAAADELKEALKAYALHR